ncbi:thiosulfate reductase cytochrome b subunit [Bradyrhizobium yuanmingense]
MASLTVTDEQVTATKSKVIQPAWVRVMHWINALAMILMILSGWQIYNASPLFDFRFPREYTLGGWLGGGLLWHFAAMWLLMINGLAYLVTGIATGPLPQEAAADHGIRRAPRRQGGADLQARP